MFTLLSCHPGQRTAVTIASLLLAVVGAASCSIEQTPSKKTEEQDDDADGGGQRLSDASPPEQDAGRSDAGAARDDQDVISTSPIDGLPGDPEAAAETAIPRLGYEVDLDGFDESGVSFNSFAIGFELGATVADVNDLLEAERGLIVGGYPGVADEASGLMMWRTPTQSDEELEALVERLRELPEVSFVAQDILLAPQVAPSADPSVDQWGWTGTSGGGNWGLKLLNIPALWNFNDWIRARDRDPVSVGIIDVGFFEHEDLDYAWDGEGDDHGTHVAGTIGARFNNGIGVDGINPFVSLELEVVSTEYDLVFNQLPDLMQRNSVINLSLGTAWDDLEKKLGRPPHELERWRTYSTERGAAAYTALLSHQLDNEGHLPQIVVAAGNDSGWAARHSLGLANAAIEWGARNISVVENLQSDTHPGGGTLASSSNLSGNISAPGTQILSTVAPNDYQLLSGTSMAAPHITGLMSYLYALEPKLPMPSLTENAVFDLMMASSVAVGGNASNRPDGFKVVFDIDEFLEQQTLLRVLVDVDDGSVDGNTRVDPITGELDLDMDHDRNGQLGDDQVDMSDFRVLRDAMAQDLGKREDLDGPSDHPKRDLNHDGSIAASTFGEVVFMRMDFNGDGFLTVDTISELPGVFGGEVTDLEVLAELFDDELYDASELRGLVASADLTVSLTQCFASLGVNEVSATLRTDSGEPFKSVTRFRSEQPRFVLSAPTGSYTLELVPFDEAGTAMDMVSESVELTTAYSDLGVEPSCGGPEASAALRFGLVPIDLSAEPGAAVTDLNDAGQVLLTTCSIWTEAGGVTATGVETPCELGESGPFPRPTVDLLEGDTSGTFDGFSRSGLVVGRSERIDSSRAYIWDGETREILADYTSEAFLDWTLSGINSAGEVVGTAQLEVGGPGFAAYMHGDAPEPLPLSGPYAQSSGELINEEGCIAGQASAMDAAAVPAFWCGEQHYYADAAFNRIVALGSDGKLLAQQVPYPDYHVSFDAETFTPLPRQYAVEIADDEFEFYEVDQALAINGSGAILALTDRGPGLLKSLPPDELDLRVEANPGNTTIRYTLDIINRGIRPLRELELTLEFSAPIELTTELPPQCLATPDGQVDLISCSYEDSELAPETSLQIVFVAAPQGTDLTVDGWASMLNVEGEAVEDRRQVASAL